MMNIAVSKPLVVPPPSAQPATVLVQRTFDYPAADAMQRTVPVALQPSDISKIQERLSQSGRVINSVPSDQPVLLTTTATPPAQAYITLTPSIIPQHSTWSESSVTLAAAPNYSVSIAPTNTSLPPAASHYVLQQSVHRVATTPEEITLNQLNSSIPSLSMTLTQLNALPAAARLHAAAPVGSPALPSTRVQTQFLPVVAMDTVLGRRGERRISSATLDSAPSDEDCKGQSIKDDCRVAHAQVCFVPSEIEITRNRMSPRLSKR